MQNIPLDLVNEHHARLLREVETERLARQLRMSQHRRRARTDNENAQPKLDLSLSLRSVDD